MKQPKCKYCGEVGHYATFCRKPRPVKLDPVKKAKKKKFNRTKLKRELEKLVKDYVKERDNYTCQHCGKKVTGSNCHASHVIPVSRNSNLQFDHRNLKVLCYHCHINWWHKNPLEAGDWYKHTFTENWEYLEYKNRQPIIPTKEYQLEEMIGMYKAGFSTTPEK